MRSRRRGSTVDRGQTNVLSVILVMAVTVLGITGIVWFGISALDTAQLQSNIQNAEQSMTSLDSQASLVGLGSSSVRHVQIHAGEEQLRVDDSVGWMNISVINSTTGGVDLVVMNTTLGAVEYENDQTMIAYQGGGVWKYRQGGSVMVSPPEFHYRISKTGAPTLTLPLVTVEGEGSITGNIRMTKAGKTVDKYPVPGDPDHSNPLRNGEVVITVNSQFYEAWGEFYAARTTGNVTYDHENETASVELIVPANDEYSNVVASTDPNGVNANPGPPPSPYQMGVDYPSADSLVEEKIAECQTNATACDETPPSPLTADTYYYDTGASGDIDIDTTAGNVTLVVNGSFTPGTVNVSGPNSVKVYVREDFAFGGNDKINEGGDADTMTVVVHSDGDVDMNGAFQFVGFLYAPESDVDLNGGGPPFLTNVIGGIVGKSIDVNGNPNKFQYDDSIANVDLDLDEGVAKITYMHVSVSKVNISS